MGFLRSVAAAFSCFSVLPMPQINWDYRNIRYLMAGFPLVGVVAGALVAGWCLLADATGMGALLRAAGIVAIPLAVSGGIHLDGFADVVDAQASHAPVERKRQILKDPHIGAFAAMGIGVYLLAYAGLAGEVPGGWHAALLLGCIQVVTRCESAAATVLLAGGTGAEGGMLAAFRESADKRATLVAVGVEYAVVAVAMLLAWPVPATAMLAVGALCLALLPGFARRNFGGMSGDVAGYYLQVCELAMLAALAVAA